eukprot:TRINITY_DN24269_c0_g1_i1.p1 TRINITY_DN24269_c0_g1~~TRINITY_DN24269_c0_g1_i1.p1  ORF type:complete len:384 (+),score=47.88 TRINITY_DN24269_c0_g1_i1:125-1153(+)
MFQDAFSLLAPTVRTCSSGGAAGASLGVRCHSAVEQDAFQPRTAKQRIAPWVMACFLCIGFGGIALKTRRGQQKLSWTASGKRQEGRVPDILVSAFASMQSCNSCARAGPAREAADAVLSRCIKGGQERAPLVVIAGPPAAGKGTQCVRLQTATGLIHVSTGDLLRAHVAQGTELGRAAERYMAAGKLVPSELIVDLMKERLAEPDVLEHGCLLDGFPRSADQAEAMATAGLVVDRFLLIDVPDADLVRRGCGRRLDPVTGDIYHLEYRPPPDDVADRLVHRSDDFEDAIRTRLAVYHAEVNAVLPYFSDVLSVIDGTSSPEEVCAALLSALEVDLVELNQL